LTGSFPSTPFGVGRPSTMNARPETDDLALLAMPLELPEPFPEFPEGELGYSPEEELWNALSHGLGLVLALAGLPFLVGQYLERGGLALLGACIFGGAAVLVYLSSTLYHALPAGRSKHFFRTLDHTAIYLLIAGTYTPFTLGVMRGEAGWVLFGTVWTIALLGSVAKIWCGPSSGPLSLGLYLAAGWSIFLVGRSALELIPMEAIAWLLAGGAFYTVGIVFFRWEALRHNHFVWHLFVIGGTSCHFVAVYSYAA
jgi:hemolysin III